MKRLDQFIEDHPKAFFVACLILCLLLAWGVVAFSDWRASRKANKQDEQIQTQIDTSHANAEASETNSNNHRDSRLEAEGRTDMAERARTQATENSRRTVDPVRKARQKYEDIRRGRTSDAPAMSDAELCAELTKRGIDCR